MSGVQSLKLRLFKLDLIFVYKVITFGIVEVDQSEFFTLYRPEVEERQPYHNYMLAENFGMVDAQISFLPTELLCPEQPARRCSKFQKSFLF